jgi:preprotein translocase subunit SecD
MRERTYLLPITIVFIALIAIWIDLPNNPGLHLGPFNKSIQIHEGLDLQGGLQVLLQADVPSGQTVSSDTMQAAQGIIENRINGLGVTEPIVQLLG